MPPVKTVAILGAGAMGGAYAAMLDTASDIETCFVARGARAQRLAREGLFVNERLLRLPVVSPDQAPGPVDLVLVALKQYHLKAALPDLVPLVGEETTFISVMNGLDSESIIGRHFGHENVLQAVAVGIDALREENRITYLSPGRLMFGETRNEWISPRVRRVQDVFDRAGIPYEIPADMQRAMWWKFMVNVGMNQASAVMRAPYGLFRTSEDARALMASLMAEVIALAAASDINLTAKDIEDWMAILPTLSLGGKTSMLQDVEAGRPTEVEMFAGKVVALGREHGIATPVNAALRHILRVLTPSGGPDRGHAV